MNARVVVLGGDGIGPEVTEAARSVLDAAAVRSGRRIDFEERLVGGASIDACGRPITDAVVEACRRCDAVLLGAVGGPSWEDGDPRPEEGLLRLRKSLGLFANLRPVRVHPALASRGPLRSEIVRGTDVLFVRELTGGLYFGRPTGIEGSGATRRAIDTLTYSAAEIRRVVEVAFRLARGRRGRVVSVDKANVLSSSRLWRSIVEEERARWPSIEATHALVDSFAFRLLREPTAFDVVVTENMFGDILTDEAAALAGSIGVLPSASLPASGPGLFEPVHGSAPDLVGQGRANPVGAILSAALLARHSLGWPEVAERIEAAVDAVHAQGIFTPDLGGTATTKEVAEAVQRALREAPLSLPREAVA